MAKKKKTQAVPILRTHIGIHSDTFEVVWINQTGSTLTRNSPMPYQHSIAPGRDATAEVGIVFGLSDVHTFPSLMHDAETTKQKVAELRAKAVSMKAERASTDKPADTKGRVIEGSDLPDQS